MPRPETRSQALRVCLIVIAGVFSVALWAALLSFDPADPPSTSVWPPSDPVNNWCGPVGARVAYLLQYYLGAGAYMLALMLTGGMLTWARGTSRFNDAWLRAIGMALVVSATSATASLALAASERYLITGSGGVLGVVAGDFLVRNLQTGGTVITLISAVIIGLLLAADDLVIRFARWFAGAGARTAPALIRGGGQAIASAGAAVASGMSNMGRLATAGAPWSGPREPASAVKKSARAARLAPPPVEEDDEPETPAPSRDVVSRPRPSPAAAVDDEDEDEANEADDVETTPAVAPSAARGPVAETLPKVTTIGTTAPPKAPPAPRPQEGAYRLPDLSLLGDPDPVDKSAIEALCRDKARILKQTLNEFRLDVDIVSIETGPVITVFELRLSPGIKVRQIASLTNDMARALRAPAVRVVAPLPGKNTIGIEVPNLDKEKVRIKDLMLKGDARMQNAAIPLYLGKDASGQALVADLAEMPHLLIAGTTGSGKSVCVSSIILSVLLTRSPQDINLILVDPKVVELAMFKDVPHLMCPIVTEMSKAEGILDWAATKMDERYALLAEAGVKDIRKYNKLGAAELRERMRIESDDEMAHIPVKLPYIVIVIDELADLMMTAAKEVEFHLCRLAQKSRAVGIHLIVSTQRPQANVVTGLIKANLPSRIAFRVSSRLDSRIVLDQNGGEVLMGQGDMLFLPPGSSKLVRAQGTYIADEELRAIVKHCRGQGEPNYHPELTRMPKASGEGSGERDELFDQAVDIILETGRGSVSLLQRRLTIGYGRASRLVDQMAEAGIVGEYKGSQAREVVITKEEWAAIRNARDREEAASLDP